MINENYKHSCVQAINKYNKLIKNIYNTYIYTHYMRVIYMCVGGGGEEGWVQVTHDVTLINVIPFNTF